MSYQQRFQCDICGTVRGPSNHWLVSFPSVDAETNAPLICFGQWDDEAATGVDKSHLCGETCAAAHLTRFIARQREEAI